MNTTPPVCEGDAATMPLLIDLDHALIRNDPVMETALAYAVANPFGAAHLIVWMLRGRGHLKQKLGNAEFSGPDPDLIPVHEKVIELAREAKQRGRQVVLLTAGNERLARRIAARFSVFDSVIASDANDMWDDRRAALIEKHFPDGYEYVGSSAADVPIWQNARQIVAVAPGRATLGKVQALQKPVTVIERKSYLAALVESARLHHWAKNTLIFVPAVLSGTIFDPSTMIACTFAFLALGLIALGTYLVNDLLDLDYDRRHWSKRARPIAAGDLPVGMAMTAAGISIIAGLGTGAWIGTEVLLALLAYLVLTLAYSVHLKRLAIVDVTVLATLFTLRIAVGIAAAAVFASPWLLVFSMALFASLSIAKRYTEIQRTAIKGDTEVPGRGYIAGDAPLVLGLGLATATASVVILVLFLIFDAFGRDVYGDPRWLWLFPVIIFLWIGRIWLICQRGELNDDPVVFALKDHQSLALGVLSVVAFAFALLGAPLPGRLF